MKIREYREKNKTVRSLELAALILLAVGCLISFVTGFSRIRLPEGDVEELGMVEMIRDDSLEDFDEDYTICPVTYVYENDSMIIDYPYEEYIELEDDRITAYGYEASDGTGLYFDHPDPSMQEIKDLYREIRTDQNMPVFNLGNALLVLMISVLIMYLYGSFFSTYEKCWFLSIMVLATVFAVIFPEESANGVNGIVIMWLYLLDTFLNILCELLISKQSRYNFLVSILVEICEIVICLVLMYRFATMAVTLFFWLPIDILSYINWTRHKDEVEDELTVVRRLKGYQEVLALLAIAVWTAGVGYLLSGLDIQTDFIRSSSLETLIIYIDACASAVGIANGLFIFFRLREQWIAWYVCAILESIINILSGQYVLLILKLGYFTNTTYGYIKWTRYIKTHNITEQTV